MRHARTLPLGTEYIAQSRHSINGSFYYDSLSSKITNSNLFLSILNNYGTLRLLTHFTQKMCTLLLTVKIDGFHFVSLDFTLSFPPPSTFPLFSPSFSPSFPFLCPLCFLALLFLLHHFSSCSVSSSVSLRLHTLSLVNFVSTMSYGLSTQLLCLGKVCFKQLMFHDSESTICQSRAKATCTVFLS